MAMISKIREKRNFLLVIIILAMLLFLLPYDAIMSFFAKNNVGEVNGEKISIAEWQNANLLREATELTYPNNQKENAVWSDIIEGRLLGPDFKALGIDVSDEEYDAITLEDTPSKFVLSTFHGGTVTPQTMQNYPSHVDAIRSDAGYAAMKELIINKRKREKWDQLVKAGMYANSIEAKMDFEKKEKKTNVEYVLKKYDDIDDSEISYDDSDIRSYYNKHKNDAELEIIRENRDVSYVTFKVDPSEADVQAMTAKMEDDKTKWLNHENDTVFVQYMNGQWNLSNYEEGTFTGKENELVLNDSVGSVIGPFENGKTPGVMNLVKIMDRLTTPDSAQVRHILLGVNSSMTPQDLIATRAKADSIMGLIADGTVTFEDMVTEHTEDPGSKDNGGNYGWFKPDANYVQPYKDFAFERNTGDLDIVTSQFGYHIMEVVEQSPKTNTVTKILTINKEIKPSEETKKAAFKEADEFSLKCKDADTFRAQVDTLGLSLLEGKNVYRSNTNVGSLRDAGKLISWIYRTDETGTVSPPQLIGDSYVVAVLDQIKEAGIPSYENVKEQMEQEVIKEKKAEKYMALMAEGSTLDEIAETVGVTKQVASGISLSSRNLNGSGVSGAEPEVVGLAFGFSPDEMSSPIKGEFGVYVISPTTEPRDLPARDEYITEQDALIKAAQNSSTQVYPAISKKASVKDMRYSN